MFTNKLAHKFSFPISCLICLISFALSILFVTHATNILKRSLEERANTLARNLAYNSEYGALTKNHLVLDALAAGVIRETDVIWVEILDKQGRSLSFKGTPKENSYYQTEVPIIVRETGKGKGSQSEELIFSYAQIEVAKDEMIGTVRLRVSLRNINQEIKKIAISALELTLIVVFVFILLTFFLVRKIVLPIEELLLATKQIRQGNLTVQAQVQTKDEIGELALSFNEMTRELSRSRTQIIEQALEKEKLQKSVVHSEKMSAIGQLAAGIAHEINNPLGVIMGFAQSLSRRITPGDLSEIPIKSIERESIRCKKLVQDLLTFSRMARVEKQESDLNAVIKNSLSLIESRTKVQSVELVKEFGADIPKILINTNQIQQIIINLCNNAIDAMPQGGVLTVKTRKAVIRNKEIVEMEVQDTGMGIPKEIQSKIFEPFFTTKEIGKGTGLGLSLVYEIAQKHSGTIEVKSELGAGTKFVLSLPLGMENPMTGHQENGK